MNTTRNNIKETVITDTQTAIQYLGQEGFILKNKKTCLGIDLYLSDFVDRNCSQTVKWERKYPSPINAEEINYLDVVICTHPHYDHMDPDTLSKLANNPDTLFMVPAPSFEAAKKIGINASRIIPAIAGQTYSAGNFIITPVPAAHECFHIDENGNYEELSYIIETDSARIFHGGDMCMYDGLTEKLGKIDVALLPINGRDYYRNKNDIIGNLTCDEAVLLAKDISAELMVPMHHDLYDVNGVSEAEFCAALNRHCPSLGFHIFRPGEIFVFNR